MAGRTSTTVLTTARGADRRVLAAGTLRRCQVCWYSGGGGDSAIMRFARCATSTRVGMLATARGYRASGFGYAPTSQTLSTKLLTGPNSGVVLHTSGDSEEEAGPLCTDTSWLKTRRLHDIRQTAEPSRRGFRSSDRRVGEQPVPIWAKLRDEDSLAYSENHGGYY